MTDLWTYADTGEQMPETDIDKVRERVAKANGVKRDDYLVVRTADARSFTLRPLTTAEDLVVLIVQRAAQLSTKRMTFSLIVSSDAAVKVITKLFGESVPEPKRTILTDSAFRSFWSAPLAHSSLAGVKADEETVRRLQYIVHEYRHVQNDDSAIHSLEIDINVK